MERIRERILNEAITLMLQLSDEQLAKVLRIWKQETEEQAG